MPREIKITALLSRFLGLYHLNIEKVAAAKSKMSKDQIKKMPYEEVKKRFGIRD